MKIVGSECRDKRLAIRLIAGAWCLTCFVLVTSYNSVLISFVTSPNAVPLITSMNDLINMSKVHLIVEKGMGHDIVISVNVSNSTLQTMILTAIPMISRLQRMAFSSNSVTN